MDEPSKPSYSIKNIFLLLMLFALFFLFIYLKLYRYFDFESLKLHRQEMVAWAEQHFWLSILSFSLICILLIACSLPGIFFVTITGGFLFGYLLATFVAVVSITLGAFLVFIAIELALRDWFSQRASSWMKSMEHGFTNHAFTYLLVLRLVPIFPSSMINVVAPLFGIERKTFLSATALGVIPSSFIYATVGSGLGVILDANQTPDLYLIFNPTIFFPLLGLAALILAPVVFKAWRHRRR